MKSLLDFTVLLNSYQSADLPEWSSDPYILIWVGCFPWRPFRYYTYTLLAKGLNRARGCSLTLVETKRVDLQSDSGQGQVLPH